LDGTTSDLTASGGTIALRIPGSTEADILFRADQVSMDAALDFEGDREMGYVDGHLNGGGPPLRARAHRGTIRCERA